MLASFSVKMTSTKKRQSLSLSLKKEIINAVENGEKKKDIAERFGLASSTLATI